MESPEGEEEREGRVCCLLLIETNEVVSSDLKLCALSEQWLAFRLSLLFGHLRGLILGFCLPDMYYSAALTTGTHSSLYHGLGLGAGF